MIRSGEIVNNLANGLKLKRQEFVQIYYFEYQILRYAASYMPILKPYYPQSQYQAQLSDGHPI